MCKYFKAIILRGVCVESENTTRHNLCEVLLLV